MPHIGFNDAPIGFEHGRVHRTGTEPNKRDAEAVLGQTHTQTDKPRLSLRQKLVLHDEALSPAQHRAVQDAFNKRLPYLSPENILPPNTTVDSLLKQKIEKFGSVEFGRANMSRDDSVIFERMQRELAAIEPNIAKRQLFQLMNGHLETHIVFSDGGMSCAFPGITGKNIIHVNTRMGILDPKSGAFSTPAIALGHEIEHCNIPVRYGRALHGTKVDEFNDAFEAYVIDGYENAMHAAIGKGERSTHSSHPVPLHPTDGTIALPYKDAEGKEQFVRAGSALHGKLVGADDSTLTLQTPDGKTATVDAAVALLSIFGLPRIHELGFADPRSILEKYVDAMPQRRAMYRELFAKDADDAPSDLRETFRRQLDGMRYHPEVRAQLDRWQAAAQRGDEMRIAVNPKGLINVHRVNTDPHPIQKLVNKTAQLQRANVRNRWIAGIVVSTAAVITAIAIYRMVQNRRRKKAEALQSASRSA